jgi:hypothetical protein
LEGGFELVDFFDSRGHATQLALIFATDDFFQDPSEHDENLNRLSKWEGGFFGMRKFSGESPRKVKARRSECYSGLLFPPER